MSKRGFMSGRSKSLGDRLHLPGRNNSVAARARKRIDRMRNGGGDKPWAAIGTGAVIAAGATAWAARHRLIGAATKAIAKRKTKAAMAKPKQGAEKISKAAS